MTPDWMFGLFLSLVALASLSSVLTVILAPHAWVSRLMSAPWLLSLGPFPVLRLSFSVALGTTIGLITDSILWGLSLASLLAFAFRLQTQWRGHQRRKQIERQLPEFCDAVSGALRAGATLRTSVTQARDQLSLPIRAEIDRLLNLFRLGLSQEEALDRWAQSSRLSAVRDLAFCAGVSSRSGGSLAPLVETIGHNLAAELALQAKADALTSQGRLQAVVMIGIPPALLLMTGLIDSSVWSFFFQSTLGSLLLWIVVVLELIGLVWIRKITQVRRAN